MNGLSSTFGGRKETVGRNVVGGESPRGRKVAPWPWRTTPWNWDETLDQWQATRLSKSAIP